MGLLDEAIREHLELKRRRGADPSELARLETEALGPVRREPFDPADSESVPEKLRERAAASQRGDGQDEAEYQEYYEREYYVEENGADWGDTFADEELEPRGASEQRGERPPEAARDPANESSPERSGETGSGRRKRGRRGSVQPTDAAPGLPAEHEVADDLADGEETVEYSVEDAVTEDRRNRKDEAPWGPSREDEEDVLEETPEFLQDAPEHDRLWFEQRPPRDFDFDD